MKRGFMKYEEVRTEALKYRSRSEFRVCSSGAYNTAKKNNWLKDVCSHMNRTSRPMGYWTYERVKAEALKYTSRSKFRVYSSGAYSTAWRNNWLEDVCSHMIRTSRPMGYWTYERVQAAALKYDKVSRFKVSCSGAYCAAKKNNWLKDVCSHMNMSRKQNSPGYWTYERVQAEALKYNTREEFRKKSGGAYSATYYHDWQNEICAHMKDCRKKGEF